MAQSQEIQSNKNGGEMSTRPTILLFSSNRRVKYFDDCLRALMLPRGMVLHFRYRRKWVEPTLVSEIESGAIKDRRVAVCYLYEDPAQEKVISKDRRPYALREGWVVDAYAVGPSVHIYFAVSGYPTVAERDRINGAALASHTSGGDPGYFAVASAAVQHSQFSEESADDAAFAGIVDAFDQRHLQMRSDDGAQVQSVDPLFLRIEGLYSAGKTLKPEKLTGASDRQRGYVLRDDNALELRVQFYQPTWSTLDRQDFSLRFCTDDHFDNPSETVFEVASLYDRTEFQMIPLRSDSEWISRAELKPPTDITASAGGPRAVLPTYEMLVQAKPIYPRWLNAVVNSGVNSVAVLLAAVAALISLSTKSSTNATGAPGSGVGGVPTGIVYSIDAILVLALLFTIIAPILKYRQRL